MPEETRARVLTINCRKSTILNAGPTWAKRRSNMIKLLQQTAPSIILAQEATVTQANDIEKGLGANWTWVGGVKAGNVVILWDGLKWDAVGEPEELVMQSGRVLGVSRDRYATLIHLRSRTTGETALFANTHLAANNESGAAGWRLKQIRQVLDWIEAQPDHERVILGGDFNDSPQRGGIRKLAAVRGYDHLRAKLLPSEIGGDTYSTFHSWTKPTPRDGRWIDDVLTSAEVVPYAAELRWTDIKHWSTPPSDHNGLLARVSF